MLVNSNYSVSYRLRTKQGTEATLNVGFAGNQNTAKLVGLVCKALVRPGEQKMHLTKAQIAGRLEHDRTSMLVGTINDEPVSAIFVAKRETEQVPETEVELAGPDGDFSPTSEEGKHFWCPLVVVPKDIGRLGYKTDLRGVSEPVSLGPMMVYSAKQFALAKGAETMRAYSRPSGLQAKMQEQFGVLCLSIVNGTRETKYRQYISVTGTQISFWLRPGSIDVVDRETQRQIRNISLREYWYSNSPDGRWTEPAAFLHNIFGGRYRGSLAHANPNDESALGYRTVIAHDLAA
ncbi:hypothetical protein A2291_07510 [candidate division WOR-1 bacterium RIFOXYB2_FULL_42_35]|uniref:Uncharacterized protein n=1 Tax=candidate division WOR-1 bacterium RIFOXYC2_FULL_41_25 TaxID=1802586 RepID=A0A1F4TKG7_UNCSA|nr:MAG: hypothetical protein A2247_04370 [candidate division WOR-1 bacterium RIFOXYA2_FULL_41_14]OGC22753.1 MAG: hypothetical protein A2291_07510 [candidate division WOR-1 bacterium RIFOXYB2_FULL_42_35]OGC33174.1 MAG: hypothetical protein A2462_06405 [candidate division WOR-1 bacterium RIFOXYC2_FULL_41_25]OGC42243.1 MAG: hypothetical protein A2548_05765 [candidate division WOR-1 bacterium RIFOXYD2_FULL_41_8]